MCEELLDAGASCYVRDARGCLPLHITLTPTLTLALTLTTDPNPNPRCLPLHMAAACGYAALAMRLILQVHGAKARG